MSIITLTTDFGLSDPYVGIMKAVIHARQAGVTIIDISHAVAPQSVVQGGLVLKQAWPYAPSGSVHVAVVDPGVGSDRRILVALAAGHRFVVPDNGLLSIAVEETQIEAVYSLANAAWSLGAVSTTFHGRDWFAPAAAALAAGAPADEAGPRIDDWQRLRVPEPHAVTDGWQGQVLVIDHFGNAITNLCQQHLNAVGTASFVEAGGTAFPMVSHYAAVPDRAPLAVLGSSGAVELCVRNDSAAECSRLKIGDMVTLRPTC